MAIDQLTPTEADATAYLRCVLGSERDPDVEGFAVRLSTFIIHLLLSVLIRFSDEDVESSVGVILLTSYSILLVTFVSMWRQQLSVADAHFALFITVSPLSVYFVYASFRDLFLSKNATSKNTILFARLAKGRRSIRALCLGLLLTWFILYVIIYFGGERVFGEQACPKITLVGWILYRFEFTAISLFIPLIVGLPSLPILYLVYSIRHLKDIRREHHRHQWKVVPWRHFTWVQSYWISIKSIIVSQWTVITSSHPWIQLFVVSLIFVVWASTMLVWVVDLQERYRNSWNSSYPSDPVPDPPETGYDPLGFGQLLAATCAVQPIYDTSKLVWDRRTEVLHFITHFHQYVWDEIVFVFTGHRNPWRGGKAGKRPPSKDDSVDLDSYPPRDMESAVGTPGRVATNDSGDFSRDNLPYTSEARSKSLPSLPEAKYFPRELSDYLEKKP